MVSKKGLKMLLGAVTLGFAGHALAANTNANTNGTIFLSLDDVSTTANPTGSSFVYDTGLSVSGFTGTTNESYTLNGAALTSFLGTISATDSIYFTVLGASTNNTTSNHIDVTDTMGGPPVPKNSQLNNGISAVQGLLGTIANPAGGSSFQGIGGQGFYAGGQESAFTAALNDTPSTFATGAIPLGTSLAFYGISGTGSGNAQNRADNSVTPFAGTWEIVDQAGTYLLEYNVAGGGGSVPLPAPLLLLLSGLGLTGLMARRSQSNRPSVAA